MAGEFIREDSANVISPSTGLNRDDFRLRENRSNAVPSEPSRRVLLERNNRTRSIQDLDPQTLRDTIITASDRSVSFNGTSAIIDTLISSHNLLSRTSEPRMLEAVNREDYVLLRRMVEEKGVRLSDILFKAVELNKPNLLSKLLKDGYNVNTIEEESGSALLHVAAANGSLECARILVENEADVNILDGKGEITPLHCATRAGSRSLETLEFLVNNDGDLNLGLQNDAGSVLHSAVRSKNLHVVQYLLNNNVQTDNRKFYDSPLHTAAENDSYEIAELLLKHNSMLVNALRGENTRLTALHIAAEHGYPATVDVLLRYNAKVSLKCSRGFTALHYAAKSSCEQVIDLILKQSLNEDEKLVNRRDEKGQTPLILCTLSTNKGVLRSMQSLILHVKKADLDSQDENGSTALHYAAINMKANRVNLLIQHGADLSIKNNAGLSGLHFIYKKVPQCMKTLESRLDSGLKLEGGTSELNSKIKLDFAKLSPSINSFQKQDITFFMELISSSAHQSLLKHPLSEAFLYLKWNQIKYLYMVFIVLSHFIFSVVYTVYALLLYCSLCEPNDTPEERWQIFNSTITCDMSSSKIPTLNLTISAWILLILFIIIYFIKELLKLAASPSWYFQQWESYHDLAIIITTVIIIWLNPLDESRVIEIGRWQYHAACIGSFSTWLYMMFLIGRVPRFGKYVQMFRTVSMSVLNFMIAYIFLIFAFATAFMIAFPRHESFALVPTAVIKLIIMMLGEIDYESLYYSTSQSIENGTIVDNVETQVFPVTAHFFLFLFTILVSIILMNLLVGLAVSDIQGLNKSARLHQLLQQVNLINYMERLMFSPYFKYIPDSFQTFLRYKLQGLQGQSRTVYTVRPHDINDKTLPESLKRSILENCLRRESRESRYNQEKELENMNRDIQRILKLLSSKDSVDAPRRQEKISTISAFSNSLAVDDDIDSDLEDSIDNLPQRGFLGRIDEEISSRDMRRMESYISNASTESDVRTISDYIGVEERDATLV